MADRVHVLRCSERLGLVLPARCRTRSGFLDRVVITDISREGCRIESRALTLGAGDLVVVRPETLEGLCGEVRWIEGHAAGVRFETSLYGPVVEHLHRTYATFLGNLADPQSMELRRAA
ncbi:MAG: PilZ domain-containing protein [Novosphingobium sp.]|nr:PilZ domain-containing protein [Novosphingobium sp.]